VPLVGDVKEIKVTTTAEDGYPVETVTYIEKSEFERLRRELQNYKDLYIEAQRKLNEKRIR
jgi:helix-turn-helix protein